MTPCTVPTHRVCRGETAQGHLCRLTGAEVSPSPSQACPAEHCTLWCINICLWLKFKQRCVAARHNREPSSEGKCLLQRWPEGQLPAEDHSARPGCPPRSPGCPPLPHSTWPPHAGSHPASTAQAASRTARPQVTRGRQAGGRQAGGRFSVRCSPARGLKEPNRPEYLPPLLRSTCLLLETTWVGPATGAHAPPHTTTGTSHTSRSHPYVFRDEIPRSSPFDEFKQFWNSCKKMN